MCVRCHAPQVLDPEQGHIYRDMTLGEYLSSKGYSDGFRFNYVLPMCAAVWSVPNAKVGYVGCQAMMVTSYKQL